jgi:SAM-dependent methyltransferase
MQLYDAIGKGYANTRPADLRIVSALVSSLALPSGSTVLDVGAGTGKYARALADLGYAVVAVEPSEVMRTQAVPHKRIRWLDSCAENLPLADREIDGAFIALALHHFIDRGKALREILRVIGSGPLVIFTFEPRQLGRFWLADYFPALGREICSSFSELEDVAKEVADLTSRKVRTIPFPLPRDLQDKFAAACWATPESYLDSSIRNGISSFALMKPDSVIEGLARLDADLASGRWDAKYRSLRSLATYDAGYKFIVVELMN